MITFWSGDWSCVWTRLSFFSFGIPMFSSLALVFTGFGADIEGTDSWEQGDKKNHVEFLNGSPPEAKSK